MTTNGMPGWMVETYGVSVCDEWEKVVADNPELSGWDQTQLTIQEMHKQQAAKSFILSFE